MVSCASTTVVLGCRVAHVQLRAAALDDVISFVNHKRDPRDPYAERVRATAYSSSNNAQEPRLTQPIRICGVPLVDIRPANIWQ
jgi:hypothetical protein